MRWTFHISYILYVSRKLIKAQNESAGLKYWVWTHRESSKPIKVKSFVFYMSEPLRAYYGKPLPSMILFDRPKKILGTFQNYRTKNQPVKKKSVCLYVCLSVCLSVKFIIPIFLCLNILRLSPNLAGIFFST